MTHLNWNAKSGTVGVICLAAAAWGGLPQVANSAEEMSAPQPVSIRDAVATEDFLRRFHDNPSKAMEEPPPRRDEFGKTVDPMAPEESIFTETEIASGGAHKARDEYRARMCMTLRSGEGHCLESEPGTRAQIRGSDRPEELIDESVVGVDGSYMLRTLEALDQRRLRSAVLPVQPWSGDYWSTYRGMLGARYGDPGFPAPGSSWRAAFQYVMRNPVWSIFRLGSDEAVDRLSPSEKYELLIGNTSFSLTQSQWAMGEDLLRRKGAIETWMGLCHGWAAAALMAPRPTSVVTLPSADGRRMLKFYPSDIKALASLLWAETSYEFRFIGGRCLSRQPRRDGNGRVIDPDCFDTNPAAWHLAVTHQLGLARRGLILDSSMDHQIWNQPALGYSYFFFNPQTGRATVRLDEARVPIRRFTQDKFRRYRSPETREVVGVVMDFTYMRGTNASRDPRDSASHDRLRTVRYHYDLELDSAGRIIGGEWYTLGHPDFLWVPVPGAKAESAREDQAVGTWVPGDPMPESWKKAARDAAQDGVPLGKLIQALLARSARR